MLDVKFKKDFSILRVGRYCKGDVAILPDNCANVLKKYGAADVAEPKSKSKAERKAEVKAAEDEAEKMAKAGKKTTVAVTYSSFILQFPEFSRSPEPQVVEAAIATAERSVSDSWPESTVDDYTALKAADILAQGPVGRNARLVDTKTGITVYAPRLKDFRRRHAMARSRTGSSRILGSNQYNNYLYTYGRR